MQFEATATQQTGKKTQMKAETFPVSDKRPQTSLKSLLNQLLDISLNISGAQVGFLIITSKVTGLVFCAKNEHQNNLSLKNLGLNEKDIRKLVHAQHVKNISFSDSEKIFRCYPLKLESKMAGALYLETPLTLKGDNFQRQFQDYITNHITLAISHFNKQRQLEKVARENKLLRQNIVQQDNLLVKGAAAAKLGHEFNNYLSGLRANIDVVLQNMKKEQSGEENFTRLSRTQKIIDSMNVLSKNLLDRNSFEPLFENIGLNDLVNNFTDFIKPIYKQDKVTISKTLQPNLPPVHLDPGLMLQVLFNLVKNAVEARPDVTINIETRTDEDQTLVQLIISDNGPGMSKDDFNYIFSGEMKPKNSGHGYGLLICKEIIDKHHGCLSVQSAPDSGTRFIISLKPRPGKHYGEVELEELESLQSVWEINKGRKS